MKKNLFFLAFLLSLTTQAQDYLSGKLIDKLTGQKDILYDRTQNDISFGVFQTIYKIADTDKKPIYTVTVTHDRSKSILFFSIKPQNGSPTARTVTYEREESGLIFSDATAMDASFVISGDYTHLFSFTDTLRTYPVLHQLKTGDKKELVLDPLSKLRIRKHKEIMKRISSLNPFNQNLFNQRDSLYAQLSRLTESVTELRSQIEKNITLLIKDKQVEQDVKRYEGEKRGGKPEGKGLQVLNGSIYSGSFEQGKFISGNVVLKNEGTEYYGQFANSNKNGTGWLKYANGSYLLGIFKNNELFTGVALQKGSDGEIYFGGYNGKRNGYGELQNNSGKYVGIFSNGRLIKGYTKEIDPFGYYTYSIIEGGAKNAIEAKIVEAFFGLMLSENN